MSLAPTNMRGAFLNWRLDVNGIQNALRSFGATVVRLDTLKAPSDLFPEQYSHVCCRLTRRRATGIFDQLEKVLALCRRRSRGGGARRGGGGGRAGGGAH